MTDPDEGRNTGRDNALWQQCWRDNDIEFHQKTVNTALIRFWSALGLAPGDRIFVPLCGKSLDLLWLAAQGHSVIGVELSPIAVRALFKAGRMQPARRKLGKFTLWQSGRIDILCGDLFDLTASDLGNVAAVFDRASLTALPEDIRHAYLAQLLKIVPAACKILLLTTEEPEAGETEDQPFAIAEEISSLYARTYDIDLSHVESLFEADADPLIKERVRIEHKAYVMTPKSLPELLA